MRRRSALRKRKGKLEERSAEFQPVDICAQTKAKPYMGTVVLRTNRTQLTARKEFLIHKKREAIEDCFQLYAVTPGNTGSCARNGQQVSRTLGQPVGYVAELCGRRRA